MTGRPGAPTTSVVALALTLTIGSFLVACGSGATLGPSPPASLGSRASPSMSPIALGSSSSASAPSFESGVVATQEPHPVPGHWVPVPQATDLDAYEDAGGSPRVFYLGTRFELTRGLGIWTSSDGWTWAREADIPGPSASVGQIVAGGPGYVAVGGVLGSPGSSAVWTSADGSNWTRVPDSPAFAGATMVAVAAGPGGLVAVGGSGDYEQPHAAVWTSPDGRTWQRVPDQTVFGTGTMEAVAAGGPGFIAVGGRFCETLCPDPGPSIWTSSDGRTWRSVDPRTIRPTGPGIGWAITRGPGPRVEAVGFGDDGHGGSAAFAWTTSDGTRWTSRMLGPAFSGAQALTVVGDAGYLAVAEGIWGSPDGQSWRAVVAPASLEGPVLTSVACGTDRCVAVGADANTRALTIRLGPLRVTP